MQKTNTHSKNLRTNLLVFLFMIFIIAACQADEPAQVGEEPVAVQATGVAPTASPTTAPPSPTSVPQPTAAPETVTFSTVDGEITGPPLPPVGFEELLESKVERGEWIYEEGLITFLKLFVGEIEEEILPEAREVISRSGTGIVQQAFELADDPTTDSTIVAELERLLRILSPTQEALDRFSQPAETTQASVPKMALQVDSTEECESLAGLGYDLEESGPGPICFNFIEIDAGNEELYRVYYPVTWNDDEDSMRWITLAEDALIKSIVTFSNFGEINGAYLLFSLWTAPLSNNTSPRAHMKPIHDWSDCPVTLFPGSVEVGEEEFQQIIAHEIFHCFSYWNFTASPYNSHEWWVEGSAEYFSNVVFPTVNFEHRTKEHFNENSTKTPLMGMSYENFVFFQYMGNRIGNPALIQLLDEMSATGGPQAHAEYLGDYPGMRGYFQDFVVSFASSGVPDTGGGNIVPGALAVTGYKDIKEEGEVKSESRPFVATRYGTRYEKEKRFLHTWSDENEGDHSFVFNKHRREKNRWGTFPEEVRSTCKDSVYALAVTTIKDEYTFTIEVTKVEKAECDPCLLGSWDIETDSYTEFVQAVLEENNPPSGTQMQVTGHYYLTFKEDGQITTLRSNLQTDMTIPNTPNVTTIVNAHGDGQYSSDGEILTVINLLETIDSFTGVTAGGQIIGAMVGSNMSTSIFGTTVSVPAGESNKLVSPQSDEAPYVCDNERLIITMDQGPVVFLRVVEIPPTPVPTTMPESISTPGP